MGEILGIKFMFFVYRFGIIEIYLFLKRRELRVEVIFKESFRNFFILFFRFRRRYGNEDI